MPIYFFQPVLIIFTRGAFNSKHGSILYKHKLLLDAINRFDSTISNIISKYK